MMFYLGHFLVKFLLISSLRLSSNEASKVCEKKVHVKVLVYDRRVDEFNNSFSIVNQYGQTFLLNLLPDQKEREIEMRQVLTDSHLTKIYKSVITRNTISAFVDDKESGYYYGVFNITQPNDKRQRVVVRKIEIRPGREDALFPEEPMPYAENLIFSICLFHDESTVTYSYILSYKSKDYANVFIHVKLGTDYIRLLFSLDDFLNKTDYLPQYILPVDEEYGYVIYPNSTYSFHFIEKALELDHHPFVECRFIRIKDTREEILEIKALVRTPTAFDDRDIFYVIDGQYNVYSLSMEGETLNERNLVAIRYRGGQFDDFISSIKVRNADAVSTNSLDYYWAVEKHLDHLTTNPHRKFTKYRLFYGRIVSQSIENFHPNTLGVSFLRISKEQLKFYSWFYEANGTDWYLHVSEATEGKEKTIQDLVTEDQWGEITEKLPKYLFPLSENSEKIVTIFSDSTWAVNNLERTLGLIVERERKNLPFENDCTSIETSSARPIGLRRKIYTRRSTTKMGHITPSLRLLSDEKKDKPRSMAQSRFYSNNMIIISTFIVLAAEILI